MVDEAAVKLAKPAKSRHPVVKPAHPKPHTCVVCGAALRSDHYADLVCDCHRHTEFNPRSVPAHELDEHVLVLLLRAGGRPLVLCRALGCEETDSNRSAIRDSVRRLNATGIVRIVACGTTGRKLAHQWRATRRRMGA